MEFEEQSANGLCDASGTPRRSRLVMAVEGQTVILSEDGRRKVAFPVHAAGDFGTSLLSAICSFTSPALRAAVASQLENVAGRHPVAIEAIQYDQKMLDEDAAALFNARNALPMATVRPFRRAFKFSPIEGLDHGYRSRTVTGLTFLVECHRDRREAATGWSTTIDISSLKRNGIAILSDILQPRSAALLALGALEVFVRQATPEAAATMVDRARQTMTTGVDPEPRDAVPDNALTLAQPRPMVRVEDAVAIDDLLPPAVMR